MKFNGDLWSGNAGICGDGKTDPGEECDSNSPKQCITTNSYAGEQSCVNCEWTECQSGKYCGDGICNGGENCETCEDDCGGCPLANCGNVLHGSCVSIGGWCDDGEVKGCLTDAKCVGGICVTLTPNACQKAENHKIVADKTKDGKSCGTNMECSGGVCDCKEGYTPKVDGGCEVKTSDDGGWTIEGAKETGKDIICIPFGIINSPGCK